ncbi:hypothetical protein FB451DRAFT_1478184 [Mycena latifolia]|nr:hypothetical protein FB451DRAFT_1478184 [Mycena latifolia]
MTSFGSNDALLMRHQKGPCDPAEAAAPTSAVTRGRGNRNRPCPTNDISKPQIRLLFAALGTNVSAICPGFNYGIGHQINEVEGFNVWKVYDAHCNKVDSLDTPGNPCTDQSGIFGCSPPPVIFNEFKYNRNTTSGLAKYACRTDPKSGACGNDKISVCCRNDGNVGIMCRFEEPPTFLQIWDRCSPNINHLHLTSFQTSPEEFRVTPHHCSAPIRLESLRITAVDGVRDWVNHPLCPFDFSGVIALSIFIYTEVVHWPKFAPVLRTLQVLDFSAYATQAPINLSPFLSLAFFRIFVYFADAWPNAFEILSTIAPANRIRKIVIYGAIASADPEELDAKLSVLPLRHLPAVEFQLNPTYCARLAPSLTRLHSRNMVNTPANPSSAVAYSTPVW